MAGSAEVQRLMDMNIDPNDIDPQDIGPHDEHQAVRNRELVEEGFWPKFRRVASRLPFAEDLLTAYYTAVDTATPQRVRITLLAALAYFVVPTDLVPDVVLGLGFTDDAAVLAAALRMLSAHIRPWHREQARQALLDVEHRHA